MERYQEIAARLWMKHLQETAPAYNRDMELDEAWELIPDIVKGTLYRTDELVKYTNTAGGLDNVQVIASIIALSLQAYNLKYETRL